jgi:hypothetical protein
VTLSLKGANSPTRGRKLRSSGTKAAARVSNGPNSLIELKKQLEARTRELDEARHHVDEAQRQLAEARRQTAEALEQQTATSEVLQVISNSPGELEPVFKAVLANAVHICEAKFGTLYLRDADGFRAAAMHNAPPAFAEARKRELLFRPPSDSLLGNPSRVEAEERNVA